MLQSWCSWERRHSCEGTVESSPPWSWPGSPNAGEDTKKCARKNSGMTCQDLFSISRIFPATSTRHPALIFGGHVVITLLISTFSLILKGFKIGQQLKNSTKFSACLIITPFKNSDLVGESEDLEEQLQVLDGGHDGLLAGVHEVDQNLEPWPCAWSVMQESAFPNIRSHVTWAGHASNFCWVSVTASWCCADQLYSAGSFL